MFFFKKNNFCIRKKFFSSINHHAHTPDFNVYPVLHVLQIVELEQELQVVGQA